MAAEMRKMSVVAFRRIQSKDMVLLRLLMADTVLDMATDKMAEMADNLMNNYYDRSSCP